MKTQTNYPVDKLSTTIGQHLECMVTKLEESINELEQKKAHLYQLALKAAAAMNYRHPFGGEL